MIYITSCHQINYPLQQSQYKRNSRAARKTKISVRDKLFQEARTQLDFYVTDDHLKEIPHLHKYAVLYVYGEFYLQEITD